jgi:hypothetical protein
VEQEVGGSSPPNCTNNYAPEFTARSAATLVLWRVVHPCLRILIRSPTIPPNFGPGDLMTIFRAGNSRFGLMLATALSAFDLVHRRPRLHPRAAAGLYRRCVPAVQFRHSRCRSHHRLHDPQQVPAFARVPGAFQGRPRAKRSFDETRWPADGHPAGRPTQGRGRQAAQEAEKTGDLTPAHDFKTYLGDSLRLAGGCSNEHLPGYEERVR